MESFKGTGTFCAFTPSAVTFGSDFQSHGTHCESPLVQVFRTSLLPRKGASQQIPGSIDTKHIRLPSYYKTNERQTQFQIIVSL
jgi:hypothetical protein